jgi:lysophospholipid acyltransferase (LPLAT)-like uncharacterized protein
MAPRREETGDARSETGTPTGRAEHRRRSGGDRLRTRIIRRVLAPLVAAVIRLVGATWRVEYWGNDPFLLPVRPSSLGAIWHRGLFIAAGVYTDSDMTVPVSLSRDGEHITAVMAALGLRPPPRGSSSRGGTGMLKGIVRLVKDGQTVVMMTDGPRGPARVSKPGVITVARLSGDSIYPVALSGAPCIRFRSWDRTVLPLPFARVIVHYGEPISVEADASPERQKQLRQELDARIGEMTDAIDTELGVRP